MAEREIDTTRTDFNLITQACPGSRMRFDPAIVPELVAWMLYHLSRLEQFRDSNQTAFEKTGLAAAAKIATHTNETMETINQMITWAGEHWKRGNWEGVCHQMRLAAQALETKTAEEPPRKPRTTKRPSK